MLRLFVAAYPDPAWGAQALTLLDGLPLPSRARATASDSLHLTLQFIGDRSDKELPPVIESVERSASGIAPFTLTPRQLVALPEAGPARLIALELDAPPPVLEIHRRLVARLARNPREHASDRFLPHITLCRFNPAPRPDPSPPIDLPPFGVREISLMRSVLRPGGAAHAVIRTFTLGDR